MTSLPIILSEGFIPVVQSGSMVSVGTVLAKKDNKDHEVINISALFALPIEEALKTLKKNPGDKIMKGEVLAERKAFLKSDKLTSNVDGVLLRIDRDTGTIVIQLNNESSGGKAVDILSPIDGTVAVCDNEKIVLATDKDVIVGTKGLGSAARAVLHPIDHSKGESVEFYHLDANVIGKVILGKKFSRDVLAKSIGMGVTGILGEDILDDDIFYLKEKGIETPVIGIATNDFTNIAEHSGKEVYLDGVAKTVLLLHI